MVQVCEPAYYTCTETTNMGKYKKNVLNLLNLPDILDFIVKMLFIDKLEE